MFEPVEPKPGVSASQWNDWKWQLKNSLKSFEDYQSHFQLSEEEKKGFEGQGTLFSVRTTPYYAELADKVDPEDPIRKILMPHAQELFSPYQEMEDPLGEKMNNPAPRVIHRYPDRVLFWLTDQCSVYCRYCTRKHFTASGQAMAKKSELQQAVEYVKNQPGVREVIFSGGDPLTVSDERLVQAVEAFSAIEQVDLIRLGTRMPVVAPMRVTERLVRELKKFHPIYIMTHFNHPREVTATAAEALLRFVDHGFPVFNQLVLLNGINNHESLIEELSRRLLKLRVKPYYMFQCDPSRGTDHLRTSVENSLKIQARLWGKISGLAMPNLSLDIPGGGGKVGLVPDFQIEHRGRRRVFRGWDGIESEYISPPEETIKEPKW